MEEVNAGAKPKELHQVEEFALELEQRLDNLEDYFTRARRHDSERLERAALMVMAFCLGFALAMELTS